MASEFIGYNVLVTLRAPPGATVQGVVADVIGQRLMLQNGMSVAIFFFFLAYCVLCNSNEVTI